MLKRVMVAMILVFAFVLVSANGFAQDDWGDDNWGDAAVDVAADADDAAEVEVVVDDAWGDDDAVDDAAEVEVVVDDAWGDDDDAVEVVEEVVEQPVRVGAAEQVVVGETVEGGVASPPVPAPARTAVVQPRPELKPMVHPHQEPEKVKADSNIFVLDSEEWPMALLLYVPNRLLDVFDIFSMRLGGGLESKMYLEFTKYGQLGFQYGDSAFLAKDYLRRLGGGVSKCQAVHFLDKSNETLFVEPTFGGIPEYFRMTKEFKAFSENEPIFQEEIRDVWSVGVGAGSLVLVDFAIHPVEIADMVLGFFFIDIMRDDLR